MKNTQKYDFLAIGSGVAGSTAVIECARNGLKSAIIDNKPYGGTCPLRGSDPKKILLGAAELYDWFSRMKDTGIINGDIRIDWHNLIQYKCSYTNNIPMKVEQSMKKMSIDSLSGNAEFVDENTIKIGEKFYTADNILVASGSVPTKLPFEGAELMSSSDDFLCLETLPDKVIFVGGGFISMEFAQAAARAGAESIIVHSGERILQSFDKELVGLLDKAAQNSGINIIVNNRVSKIETDGDKLIAHLSNSEETIRADMIVHGAGRMANVYNMNLENGNVAYDVAGIKVNEFMQNTSNPYVYAAGDVTDSKGPYLATVAAMEGKIAAENIINGNKKNPTYENIPSVVFTIPTLASVGMQEEDAEKSGIKYNSRFQETSDWFTSYRIGEKYSGYKIITDENNTKILGAHLLGPSSEDVINLFTFAINRGITPEEMRNMVYSYPTASSDIVYMF